jgi:hypothetical protein
VGLGAHPLFWKEARWQSGEIQISRLTVTALFTDFNRRDDEMNDKWPALPFVVSRKSGMMNLGPQ